MDSYLDNGYSSEKPWFHLNIGGIMNRIYHVSLMLLLITLTYMLFSSSPMAEDNNSIKGNIISDITPDNISVFYLRTEDGIPIYITDDNFINSHPDYNWIKNFANTNKVVILTGTLEENEEGEFQFKNNQFSLIKEEVIDAPKDEKYIYNSPLNNYFMKCEKANPEFITVGQFLNDIIKNNKNNGKDVKIDTKKISNDRYRFDMFIFDPMSEKKDNVSIGYNLDGNIAYMSYLNMGGFTPGTKMEIAEWCTRFLLPYYEKYKGNSKK